MHKTHHFEIKMQKKILEGNRVRVRVRVSSHSPPLTLTQPSQTQPFSAYGTSIFSTYGAQAQRDTRCKKSSYCLGLIYFYDVQYWWWLDCLWKTCRMLAGA